MDFLLESSDIISNEIVISCYLKYTFECINDSTPEKTFYALNLFKLKSLNLCFLEISTSFWANLTRKMF